MFTSLDTLNMSYFSGSQPKDTKGSFAPELNIIVNVY